MRKFVLEVDVVLECIFFGKFEEKKQIKKLKERALEQ